MDRERVTVTAPCHERPDDGVAGVLQARSGSLAPCQPAAPDELQLTHAVHSRRPRMLDDLRMPIRSLCVVLFVLTAAFVGFGRTAAAGHPAADANESAGGVRLVRVGSFRLPVHVTGPPDDPSRVMVVERDGRIRVVKDGKVQRRPFLDIRRRVRSSHEQGLLSLAFAPDYAESGLFYVYFTDRAGNQRVVEFRRRGR